ncbi:unnamed protein product [Ostreobium quekettii]|uniref:Lon protease homolog n=1 Tax=Ostreobium quekettii TaxID=121088 RepID=A0A8S1JC80_9CHLO|nr:unnamed protein product [Ostreobium quekettii]|eukprot:evm.model.scf_602.2 EVM.evm.TU.scf_602.2   scf_602:42492-51143(-)
MPDVPKGQLPLLPLHNEVLLPSQVVQLVLWSGNAKSDAFAEYLSTQKEADLRVAVIPVVKNGQDTAHIKRGGWGHRTLTGAVDNALEGLHSIGTAARVVQLSRIPQEKQWTLALEGLERIHVHPKHTHVSQQGLITVEVEAASAMLLKQRNGSQRNAIENSDESFNAIAPGSEDEDALGAELISRSRELLTILLQQTGRSAATQMMEQLQKMPPSQAADIIGSLLAMGFQEKLAMLDAVDHGARLRQALKLLARSLHTVHQALGQKREADSKQPDGGWVPVLGTIGQGLPGGLRRPKNEDDDIAELMKRIQDAEPPPEVLKHAFREARRIRRGGEHHPSYAMSRSYIELLAELPWKRLSTPALHNLQGARNILDSAHYGLELVKARVVHYVAVQQLKGSGARAPILCFVGPPGVGKTSLAASVANVLGRPFARISLGGVRDEAEIRGHRKTYVGAMPGRVIQALRRVNVRDPVMLLDEVDKMGKDIRGDPASALLEVLDPEQHHAFVDAYVGFPFDLSRVVFLATANRTSEIPAPLLDRMEVIRLPGYTLQEKVKIAEKHLLPKVLEEHGLGPGGLVASPDNPAVVFPEKILRVIVERYTREAGVRALERCLAAVCRQCAYQIVKEQEERAGRPFQSFAQGGASSRDVLPLDAATWRDWENEWNTSSGFHKICPSSFAIVPTFWAESPMLHQHQRGADAHPMVRKQASEPLRSASERFVEDPLGMPTVQDPQTVPSEEPRQENTGWSTIVVDEAFLELCLGAAKYYGPEGSERVTGPGVAAGLVWTPTGGMVQYIECCCISRGQPGRLGELTLTGHVGDVLEESAMTALSWVRSHAHTLGFQATREDTTNSSNAPASTTTPAVTADEHYGRASSSEAVGHSPAMCWDIHMHLPAGAVPKDGPSAGITLAVALVSLFANRAVRHDTAMTGEVTLRGLVLPVGGIKEKFLAAHQAGFRRVILPQRNVKDVVAEVSKEVQEGLETIGTTNLEEVIRQAFDPPYEVLQRSRL